MKKSLVMVMVCAGLMVGCQSTNAVSTTTGVATTAAVADMEKQEAETTEPADIETDGTQAVAEIEQPTLSEAARKAVEESIAAMHAAVEETEPEPEMEEGLPTSINLSVGGKSLQFPLGYEEFKSLYPDGVQMSGESWVSQVDEVDEIPFFVKYVNDGKRTNLMWFSENFHYSIENESVGVTPMGHFIGELVNPEELATEGFTPITGDYIFNGVTGQEYASASWDLTGVSERISVYEDGGNFYIVAVAVTSR